MVRIPKFIKIIIFNWIIIKNRNKYPISNEENELRNCLLLCLIVQNKMIYSKITCRLVKLKNAPNCHINKNFTRNYNIESGSNWQKISFPNPDIEKYTFSFISNDVTYHLLGIVPYHKHSDVVVKEVSILH